SVSAAHALAARFLSRCIGGAAHSKLLPSQRLYGTNRQTIWASDLSGSLAPIEHGYYLPYCRNVRCRESDLRGNCLPASLLHGALCLISGERSALSGGSAAALVELSGARLHLENYPGTRRYHHLVSQAARFERRAGCNSANSIHWRPVAV